MKKHCLLLAIFAAAALRLVGQNLSDSARISLMTVAPGEEVYSIFGHSALRVFDPANGYDRCYNYGTFEFEQPNFLLKFCRGKLLYYLNVEPTRAFERGNLYERRAMQEQLLNLQPTERQRLFQLLQENAREENRYYKYDFFYDNCATRIRDIVKEAHFHQINFDTAGLEKGRTMRHLLRPYLEKHPWTQFGIDLVLGLPADRRASAQDWMFLPDHLHDLFARANFDGAPLVRAEREMPEGGFPSREIRKPDPVDGFLGSPLWVMCFVAVVGLLSMANPRTARIFDAIFWFVLGLAGLVMALLWFATDHSATKSNLNILWALPTHLLFFWRSRHRSELTDNYFMGTAILTALTLLFWKFLPQEMPLAAVPLALLVVVKGYFRRSLKEEKLKG